MEVLVVAFVIGVVAALAVLSLDVTDTQEARNKMRQMQIMMRSLADAAVLEGKAYGVKWRPGVATPMIYEKNGWRKFNELEETKWAKHLQLEVVINGVVLPLEKDAAKELSENEFEELSELYGWPAETSEEADEFSDDLESRELREKANSPQIFFLPSGVWQPAGRVITKLIAGINNGFSWGATGFIEVGE